MEPVTDHWWQPYPTPESFLDEDVKWGEGLEVFGPPCDAALDRNAILARNSAKHPLVPAASCHWALVPVLALLGSSGLPAMLGQQ